VVLEAGELAVKESPDVVARGVDAGVLGSLTVRAAELGAGRVELGAAEVLGFAAATDPLLEGVLAPHSEPKTR